MYKNKTIITPTHIQLYSESFGDTKNPAILLIAGSVAPAHFWPDDFCTALATNNYFVIRYDNRDIGLSSSIDYKNHPYSLKELALDATLILDAYQVTQAHIIGHSMGGSIAQTIALDFPQRVLSITLISSSILTIATIHMKEIVAISKLLFVIMQNSFNKNIDQSITNIMNIFKHLHGDIPMDQSMAQEYITDIYERSNPAHNKWLEKYAKGKEPLHNHFKAQVTLKSRLKELTKISIPTMLIHGEKDTLIPARIADKYIAQIIPHAQMHIIPDMGHMILNHDLWIQIKDLIFINLSTIEQ